MNPIHEGTHGIQALDLLGRKLWQHNSRGFKQLGELIEQTIKTAQQHNSIENLGQVLAKALQQLSQVTQTLGNAMHQQGADKTLANASLYLDCFGKVVISWLWLKQAILATEKLSQLDENSTNVEFFKGKIQAAKYFINWELPEIYHPLELLSSLDPICFEMKNEWF